VIKIYISTKGSVF